VAGAFVDFLVYAITKKVQAVQLAKSLATSVQFDGTLDQDSTEDML
jgi:hypothetical protein